MSTMTQSYDSSLAHGFVSTLIERLFSQRPRPEVYLDVRELPDHLKRDLGFLDGRDPTGSKR